MYDLWNAVARAVDLLRVLDKDLLEIIGLSLQVSLVAVGISALIGMPLGAWLALHRFPGRQVSIVVLNALMGLPPVVVGLLVYLLFSRAGPFGIFGLLFTPAAMIIAQVILVVPIVASLTRESLEALWAEYDQTFRSLGASPFQSLRASLWDGRFGLATALLAGFGRASAEVGAVMIVGGNIEHMTRVMTTAIALEASRGDLSLALGLGIVLLVLSFSINAVVYVARRVADAQMAG